MQVTGNTLIAFQKWLSKKEKNPFYIAFELDLDYGKNTIPDDMKIGVFISFFESVGIILTILNWGDEQFNYVVSGNPDKTKVVKTRDEANTAAVEKADELFNSRS